MNAYNANTKSLKCQNYKIINSQMFTIFLTKQNFPSFMNIHNRTKEFNYSISLNYDS